MKALLKNSLVLASCAVIISPTHALANIAKAQAEHEAENKPQK